MNKAEKEFLLQFDTKLKKKYSKEMPTVKQLIEDISKRKIPLASYNIRPTKEDLAFVAQATKVLSSIQKIIDSPDITPKLEQVAVPASNARNVDGRCLARTMRDSSLWVRNELGEMEPELVYSNVSEDSVDTYENCFVKLLIDRTIEVASEKVKLSYERMASVEKQTYVNSQNTDIFSAVSSLTSGHYGRLALLSKDNDKGLDLIDSLNKIRERYTKLKSSPFYANAVGGRVDLDKIVLTDNMKGDARLYQCYEYYKKALGHTRNEFISQEYYEDCYYNYVLFRIMSQLQKMGCKYNRSANLKPAMVKSNKSDNKVRVTTITYKYKAFQINVVAKQHGIYIDTRYIKKDIERMPDHAKQIKSRLYLHISNEDFSTKYRAVKAMEKAQVLAGEKIICDNCLLVSPNESIGNPNLVLTVSPVLKYTNHKLDDFTKTLAMALPGSSRIYNRKCPICGENYLTHEIGFNKCEVCGSEWSVLTKKLTGKGMVFVKKLGGDNYYSNKIKDLRSTRSQLKELKELNKELLDKQEQTKL